MIRSIGNLCDMFAFISEYDLIYSTLKVSGDLGNAVWRLFVWSFLLQLHNLTPLAALRVSTLAGCDLLLEYWARGRQCFTMEMTLLVSRSSHLCPRLATEVDRLFRAFLAPETVRNYRHAYEPYFAEYMTYLEYLISTYNSFCVQGQAPEREKSVAIAPKSPPRSCCRNKL